MNITFCSTILSNSYKEVFKNKEIFNNYINKSSVSIATFSNLNIYLTFKGKITLNVNIDFTFNCNYFIVYEGTFSNRQKQRAYFITSWEVYNNTLEVEYEIDIWHTWWYNKDWRIRLGLQTRTSIIDENREHSLPVTMNVKNQYSLNPYNKNYYDVIVEVIRYTLTNDGKQSEINCYTGYITYYDNPNSINYNLFQKEWDSNFTKYINQFLKDQSTGRITNGKTYYYSINKIYTVRSFIFDLKVNSETTIVTLSGDGTPSDVDFKGWSLTAINNANITVPLLYNLKYNYLNEDKNKKFYGVGTVNHIFLVPNDGIIYTPYVNVICNNNGFSIILRIGDMYEEISDDLTLSLPYDVTDASSRALRDISTKLQAAQGTYMITQGAANILQSTLSSGGNVMSSLQRGGVFNIAGTALSSLGNIGGGIIRGGAQIELGNKQLEAAYTDRYSTLEPKKGSSSSYLQNCITNIAYWIPDISNEDEMNEALVQTGYIVKYLVTDIYELDNVTSEFDAVKFDYINLYGNLPCQFISLLSDILSSGVHILCNENI